MELTGHFIYVGFLLFYANTFLTDAKLECVPPFIPMNGSISPVKSTYEARDEITYACDKGFMLVGNKKRTRTCRSNRKWTNLMPFCDAPFELQGATIEPNSRRKSNSRYVTDKNQTTCFTMDHTIEVLRVRLKEKAVTNGVRIFLPKGEYYFQVSTLHENKNCATFHGVLEEAQWIELLCKEAVVAEAIFIKTQDTQNETWELCEVEVYAYLASSCSQPPTQFYLPDGQFIISRDTAMMKCNPFSNSVVKYFACENNSWRGIGNCEVSKVLEAHHEPRHDKITIIVTVTMCCLISVSFVAFICIYYKRRQTPVVFVIQPPKEQFTPAVRYSPFTYPEHEYSSISYEEAPLRTHQGINTSQDVHSSLPDILKEYGRPFGEEGSYPYREMNLDSRSAPVYSEPQDCLPRNISQVPLTNGIPQVPLPNNISQVPLPNNIPQVPLSNIISQTDLKSSSIYEK